MLLADEVAKERARRRQAPLDGPRRQAAAEAGRRVAPEVFAVEVVPAGQPGLVAPGLQVDEVAPECLQVSGDSLRS